MEDIELIMVAGSMVATLEGRAGALVDPNLDEAAADRLSVVTGGKLGRISRALAQASE